MNPNIPDRVKTFDQPSVWLEFSPLSKATNSINLGQGFPDWAPPAFVQEAARKSVTGGQFSTYARSAGHLHLIETLKDKYESQLSHKIDSSTEVLITVGASEALFLSIMTFIGKGDEVIIIEPAFDLYFGALAMAEASIKSVSLIPESKSINSASQLILDWDKLEKTLSSDTKAIFLNTPHNPTGKVFSRCELERLAKLLKKYPDCLVISDEVYEHITFDNKKHHSIASFEGMFDRTLTISSAGKTFSVTGWKVGWLIGPQKLIKRLQLTQQWVVFSVSTPHQEAIANCLKEAQSPYQGFSTYYKWLEDLFTKKRQLLFEGLKKASLNPIMPEGSFFILCDIQNNKLHNQEDLVKIKELNAKGLINIDMKTMRLFDYNFCRSLSLQKKVTSIPTSAFYLEENKENACSWARFAFCKDDKSLKSAIFNLLD